MGLRIEAVVTPDVYTSKQKNNSTNNKTNIEFVKSDVGTEYETNTNRNIFLKEYLEAKSAKQGVKIPDGMKISVSSYKFDANSRSILRELEMTKYWTDTANWWQSKSDKNKSIEEYCKEKGLTDEEKRKVMDLYRFHDVRVNIFGARISDMFKLLSQDSQTVTEKTEQMKIPDEDKAKIIALKNFFDNYYKVEAEYNGKKIDLLHLTAANKEELREISPEFAVFIEKEQPALLKHTIYFAQQEMKAEELSDAGNSSRLGAYALSGILAFSIGKGVFDSKNVKKTLLQSEKFINYVKTNPEGKKILEKCIQKYNKLGADEGMEVISRYMKKIGFEGGEHFIKQQAIYKQGMPKFVNPIKAFKGAKGAALAGLIWTAILGSADDCMGAGKDFLQDQNNFGNKTALGIGALSVAAGIASSVVIAPTIEGMIDYNRAEKTLIKNGFVQKAKGISKLKKYGKLGLIGALVGMVTASSSSGSSWASMALTRAQLGLNGSKLKEKNIIAADEDTFSASNKNMMEYEAYKGKWSGITKGDWSIGAVGGALGLFTHTNPYVQSLSFGLQGCSETLTACGYQMLGNKVRETQIERDKKNLVNSQK